MRELQYFIDLKNDFLLAYERTSEFFVMYIPAEERWVDCAISFSEFRHDYNYREISRDKAMERAGGCLPEANYMEYVAMLDSNLGR